MRKLLALLFSIIAICPCSARENDQSRYLAFVSMLERELGKHDVWVRFDVEADYSAPPRAHVKLRRIAESRMKAFEKMGVLGYDAAYHPASDELLIPYRLDRDTADSISHELWHALYDAEGKLGILRRREFSGPSIAEIEKFAKKKIAGKEFQKVLDEITTRRKIENLKISLGILLQQTKSLKESLDNLTEIQRYRTKAKELDSYINPATRESIENDLAKMASASSLYNPLISDILRFILEVKKKSSQTTKEPSRMVASLEAKASALTKRIDAAKGFIEESKRLRLAVMNAYSQAAEKRFLENDRKRAAAILSEKDPKARVGLQDLRDLERSLYKAEKIGRDLDIHAISLTSALNKFASLPTLITSSSNVLKLDEVFGDANEIMARIVNSAYSLYYGKVKQNHFPLSETDLQFLERFRWKQEPLFRKAVEKYRVGLSMIARGVPWMKVKSRLEYATSLAYLGKRYSWPATTFTIKGDIPFSDR